MYCFSSSGRGGAIILLCRPTPLNPSRLVEELNFREHKVLKVRLADDAEQRTNMLSKRQLLNDEKFGE
jgi:hypothetical protein